jgi:hypothetical protein
MTYINRMGLGGDANPCKVNDTTVRQDGKDFPGMAPSYAAMYPPCSDSGSWFDQLAKIAGGIVGGIAANKTAMTQAQIVAAQQAQAARRQQMLILGGMGIVAVLLLARKD